jgi:MoxR-like ATPase
MQERTVTIDRESHRLSPNFTVFATQNPIESEGTYPLPEAQKDRFMLKIPMTGRQRRRTFARPPQPQRDSRRRPFCSAAK